MSNLPTSKDTVNVTFSQALEAGLTHCDWLAGRQIDPSGRARALASHSVVPANAEGPTTPDTYGPLFAGSSPNAARRWSLASRLQARMPAGGSMEYTLTWRRSAIDCRPMKMGTGKLTLYRLAASAHHTSASGCTGWPTPNLCERGPEPRAGKRARGSGGIDLQSAVRLTGWGTPRANDAEKRGCPIPDPRNGLVDQAARGLTIASSDAGTGTLAGSVLSPEMPRWLMGFPAAFDRCAPGWKEWGTLQSRLAECSGDLEAFWLWLVEVGLADCEDTGMP